MNDAGTPDWHTLPSHLAYLINDAARYGGINDADERATVISRLSTGERDRLASVAVRAQEDSDAIFAWIDGHELHRASILLYWLMVFFEEIAPEPPSTHVFTSPGHLQPVIDRLQSQRFVASSADRLIKVLHLKPGLKTIGMITATDELGLEFTIFVTDDTHVARKVLVMLVFGILVDVKQEYAAFENMITRSVTHLGEETVDDSGMVRKQWPLDGATMSIEMRSASNDVSGQVMLALTLQLPTF